MLASPRERARTMIRVLFAGPRRIGWTRPSCRSPGSIVTPGTGPLQALIHALDTVFHIRGRLRCRCICNGGIQTSDYCIKGNCGVRVCQVESRHTSTQQGSTGLRPAVGTLSVHCTCPLWISTRLLHHRHRRHRVVSIGPPSVTAPSLSGSLHSTLTLTVEVLSLSYTFHLASYILQNTVLGHVYFNLFLQFLYLDLQNSSQILTVDRPCSFDSQLERKHSWLL